MRILADTCVEAYLVAALRQRGHDVIFMAEVAPDLDDGSILQRSWDENRILLTGDLGFGRRLFKFGRVARGVILLRLAEVVGQPKIDLVLDAIFKHGDELRGGFMVIRAGAIRVRPILGNTEGREP